MADLTLTIGPEEFAGLVAVGDLDAASGEPGTGVEEVTQRLLRAALAARLAELGLPWSPSAEDVRARAAAAQKPAARGFGALARRPRARRFALSLLLIAVLTVLWGGYVLRWRWTGFQANAQLWDWMHLLLLPVVTGSIPLWIERPAEFSRSRRLGYAALLAAFAGFVLAGYLIPLTWTGFPGITLWDWFGLILLPAAVASVRLVPSVVRALRPHHRELFGVLALAWAVTIAGGYGLGWRWTGYQGNTLWDWLQMLLLPLIVPTILLPTLVGWMTGGQPAAVVAGAGLGRPGPAAPARARESATGRGGGA